MTDNNQPEPKPETLDDLASGVETFAVRRSGEDVELEKSEPDTTEDTEEVDTADEAETTDDVDGDEPEDTEEAGEEDTSFDDEETDDDLGIEDILAQEDEPEAEDTEEDDPEEGAKDREDKKRKKSTQARINDLTKRLRMEEEERIRAQQELKEAKEQLKNAPNDDKTDDEIDLVEPDPKDTEKYPYGELDENYRKDVRKYDREMAKAEFREEMLQSQQSQAVAAKRAEMVVKLEDVKAKGAKLDPDFEENVINRADRGDYHIDIDVVEMGLNSDVGHHIFNAIANNPKLEGELKAMTPTDRARAFGRLEARYSAKSAAPKKKVTKAPAPPRRKSAGTGAGKKLDTKTASVEEIERAWRRGELN